MKTTGKTWKELEMTAKDREQQKSQVLALCATEVQEGSFIHIFDTKTLNLAKVSSFSPWVINLLRIVEQQILALLLIHQTHNLSHIRVCVCHEAVSKLTT